MLKRQPKPLKYHITMKTDTLKQRTKILTDDYEQQGIIAQRIINKHPNVSIVNIDTYATDTGKPIECFMFFNTGGGIS